MSLNISDFSSFSVKKLQKSCPPSSFLATPLSKLRFCQVLSPFFQNLVGGKSEKGGTHYLIYQKWKEKFKEETESIERNFMISIYGKNKNKKYTYPDYANSKVFSSSTTLDIHFSFTWFIKEVFLNVMLKAIYSGSSLKFIGKFVPTYNKICIPNFDLRKGNLNIWLQQCMATPLSLTGQKTLLNQSGHWFL